MLENFVISIVIFIVAIAVYKDAKNHAINGAAKWGVGVSFIWFAILPIYLFKRKKMIKEAVSDSEINGTLDEKPISPFAATALMFVLSFSVFFIGLYKGELPSCESAEVSDVVAKLLNSRDFSDQAQTSYEKISEIRHCNLTMNGNVFPYTVSWYSEAKDNFVVQFNR